MEAKGSTEITVCTCVKCGKHAETCCDNGYRATQFPHVYESVNGVCRDCCDCVGARRLREWLAAETVKHCGGVAGSCYYATGLQYGSALAHFAACLKADGDDDYTGEVDKTAVLS